MHATIAQRDLRRGLAAATRAVAARSPLPILSHVLLSAEEQQLTLVATNLEIGISIALPATTVAAGAASVPARLLSDLVGDLSDQPLDLRLDSAHQTLQLRGRDARIDLRGLPAEEFPTLPSPGAAVAQIDAAPLRAAITQVAPMAARDDARPVLAGIAVQLQDDTAVLTGSDGFRLARRQLALASSVPTSQTLIIPARALAELARCLAEDDSPVTLSAAPDGGQARFQAGALTLISRLIDGRYPDVARIIPQSWITRAVCDRRALLNAARLAGYVASAAAQVVELTIGPGDAGPGQITLRAQAAEVGANELTCAAQMAGEYGVVRLNVSYLANALEAIASAQVALEIQGERRPVVIRPVGEEELVCVIMPMQLR